MSEVNSDISLMDAAVDQADADETEYISKESNDDTNIVEALRSKTEEADLKQVLKSNLGGYTKKSVLEYLSALRRQQQTMADTFSRNQQTLFEEKENLKINNELTKSRLNQVEADYENLTEAMRTQQQKMADTFSSDQQALLKENEDLKQNYNVLKTQLDKALIDYSKLFETLQALQEEEKSSSEIEELKETIRELEDKLNNSCIEKNQCDQQIEKLTGTINESLLKLQQLDQDSDNLQEMLKVERLEAQKQRSIVTQLSGVLEEKNDEINTLKDKLSQDQITKLTEKLNDLSQQLSTQTELVANYSNDSVLKSQTIETLNQENDTIKQRIAYLSKSLEEMIQQNSKLLFVNKSLSDHLTDEYKRSVTLINEKSGLSMDKMILAKKLDEANSTISMLEMHLQKQISSEELDNIYKSSDQTEALTAIVS